MRLSDIQPPLGTPLNRSHPLSLGLIHCWLMNEGGGIRAYDSAFSNTNGTLVNGPVFQKTAKGNSLFFDGSTDYVGTFSRSISPVGSRTLSAWIRPADTTRRGIIGTRPSVASTGFAFSINLTTAGNLTYFHTGGTVFTVAAGVTTNTWQHVAVTLDRTSAVAKMYYNGNLIGTQTSFSSESSSAFNGIIGNENDAGTGKYFSGLMNNVMVYNRALLETEIRRLYLAPYSMFYGQQSGASFDVPAAVAAVYRFFFAS